MLMAREVLRITPEWIRVYGLGDWVSASATAVRAAARAG